MTDQRLRELLDERVADVATVDLASRAWERASVVRTRRRAVVGVAVAVVAIVGTTTVVVSGRGDDAPPPPATNNTESPAPKAERGGDYGGVPVWWAPTTDQEASLPQLAGSGLPEQIDLSATDGEVPAGMRAVGLFQLWGDEPGDVVVVGADGATYSLDISTLDWPAVRDGNVIAPLTQSSLSPDGRYGFFVQQNWLDVYDFEDGGWSSVRAADGVGELATWSADGEIRIPDAGGVADPEWTLYDTDGNAVGADYSPDIYVGARRGDDSYGPIVRGGSGGARGVFLAGPVTDPRGVEVSSVDAVGAGGTTKPDALLAFPPSGSDDGRWLQCCSAVGWLDPSTVLFESRWADARILAWRVGTRDLFRVSDIRGWTPGEESYVASFAAVDHSVTPPAVETAAAADAEFQGVPIWWSPDVSEEARLPWLEQDALPREFDAGAAAQIAPELDPDTVPVDRAVAAFPYPNPQHPEWILLLGPDGALAEVDVRRLESWGDANAPYDLATRNMLAPDGRHLAFAQRGRIEVVDLGTGVWSSFPVDGAQTAYFTWDDPGTLVLAREGTATGPLYSLDGERVSDAGGNEPGVLFDVAPAFSHEYGDTKTSPAGAAAHAWGSGNGIPVPEEGNGQYGSDPAYLAILGEEPMALAFAERVDEAPRVFGAVAAGWLEEQTVVYESQTDEGHFLIAWRLGTREFWRVMEIVDSPSTFFGGPSFADFDH